MLAKEEIPSRVLRQKDTTLSNILIVIDGQSVRKHGESTGQLLDYRVLIDALVKHNRALSSQTHYFTAYSEGGTQDRFLNLLRSSGVRPELTEWKGRGLEIGPIEELVDRETFDVLVLISSAPHKFKDLVCKVRDEREISVMVITFESNEEEWRPLVDEVFTLRRFSRRNPGVIEQGRPVKAKTQDKPVRHKRVPRRR